VPHKSYKVWGDILGRGTREAEKELLGDRTEETRRKKRPIKLFGPQRKCYSSEVQPESHVHIIWLLSLVKRLMAWA